MKKSEVQGAKEKLQKELDDAMEKIGMHKTSITRWTRDIELLQKKRGSFHDGGENASSAMKPASRRATFMRKSSV